MDVFDLALERALLPKNREVRELLERGCLYDRVVEEVRGRRIRIGERWLVDFASCNYLGLDLDERVMDAIPPEVRRFGTHPSWARMAASPVLYEVLEARLAHLLGTEDALVLPTISLIAAGLIPALSCKGAAIFADRAVHKVNHDGCRIARDMGAQLSSFRHDDPDQLAAQLAAAADAPLRLIVVDGVLSVTGRVPALARIVELARRHDALVYIDDAHGFGVLGESPTPERPYGVRGNGVVRHLGLGWDNVVYVAGMSKAYSSLAAFVAIPTRLKAALKCTVTSYLVSGPVPTAALATAIAGLELNAAEGEVWRDRLYRHSRAIHDAYRERGIATDNDNAFPILSAYVGEPAAVLRGGQLLWDEGIYVTLQSWPLVPRDRGVLRATPTAANTDEEVVQLIEAMTRTVGTLRREGLTP
jgi:8-amino-7-oxononanoate synthase